jgi:hypothetical protein
VKDVIASYDALVYLFQRMNLFLERLNGYIGITTTKALSELLWKIMAQVLSILALSAKTMMRGRTSWSIPLGCHSYLMMTMR